MSYGWAHSYPKARKSHWCQMCRRAIGIGEVYFRGAGFDGTAWSWRECLHCEAIRKRYDIYDGSEYDELLFVDWSDNPRDVPELRAAAGYKMKWRTRTGTLLPVPA